MTESEITSKNWCDISILKSPWFMHERLHFKQFLTSLYEYLNVLHKKDEWDIIHTCLKLYSLEARAILLSNDFAIWFLLLLPSRMHTASNGRTVALLTFDCFFPTRWQPWSLSTISKHWLLNHEIALYGSTKIQVFLLLSKFALIRQVGIFNQKKVFFGLMIIICLKIQFHSENYS